MNDMIAEAYIKNRNRVMNYTNQDMNLALDKDDQIYIAVFDIPNDTITVSGKNMTLALVYGLNTHIYYGDGYAIVDLEKRPEVMKAMQSLFISAPQVLDKMTLTNDTSFIDSSNVRAYLKTRKGIYYSELTGSVKEERFLQMLLDNVMKAIAENIGKK